MTLWDFLIDGDWQFNHSEVGTSDADAPTPRFPSQKWWPSKTWRKRIVPASGPQVQSERTSNE